MVFALLLAGLDTPRQPRPVFDLKLEGRLPGTAEHKHSLAAARDLDHMRGLAARWRRTGDRKILVELSYFLDAWTRTYRISLNPINETRFDGLIEAYALTKRELPASTGHYTAEFIRSMANGYLSEIEHHSNTRSGRWINNWQSHRVKLVTISAVALADRDMFVRARAAYRRQVVVNIGRDGEVIDFRERDALRYVVYDLEPLMQAAAAARSAGEDWLPSGKSAAPSLRAALAWLAPYARGEKSHEEFAKTTVRFDDIRKKAKKPGFSGKWNRGNAAELYWWAAGLDQSYVRLAQHLRPQPSARICASAPFYRLDLPC